MNKKRIVVPAITAMLLIPNMAQAQETTDSLNGKKEKPEERNVMLNASDATKPREIQIGLPSEDVNVYENGLPAVYSSSVHQLAAIGAITLAWEMWDCSIRWSLQSKRVTSLTP